MLVFISISIKQSIMGFQGKRGVIFCKVVTKTVTKKTGSYDVALCHAKKANYAKYQIKMTDTPARGDTKRSMEPYLV